MRYYDGGEFVGIFPAMIHLFRAADGAPRTYHVTYLTPDGAKADVPAPKKVLPGTGPLTGGAIRLFPAAKTLGIAEGIETAIAATQGAGIPCWASYSATLLEQFQPPEGVERVVIFGDNDSSFTGQKSAYVLAHRLHREGFGVEVRIPESQGTDWADEVAA
jgi:putative DNA primase/helicase